jgi:hypothetical protein
VLDRSYAQIEGTDPPQYNNGFADFADQHVRTLLDGYKAKEPKILAAVITNLDGYLPTHNSERCQKPGRTRLGTSSIAATAESLWTKQRAALAKASAPQC